MYDESFWGDENIWGGEGESRCLKNVNSFVFCGENIG